MFAQTLRIVFGQAFFLKGLWNPKAKPLVDLATRSKFSFAAKGGNQKNPKNALRRGRNPLLPPKAATEKTQKTPSCRGRNPLFAAKGGNQKYSNRPRAEGGTPFCRQRRQPNSSPKKEQHGLAEYHANPCCSFFILSAQSSKSGVEK